MISDTYAERGIDQVREEDVLEFVSHILESECGLRVRDRLTRSIAQYFARFQPEKDLFVGLYREDTLRALLAVDHINNTTAVLKWIFVGARDGGQGTGSRLLDRAIRFATHRGYQKLILCTMTKMESAHHLYRKKGFVFKQRVTFWRRPMQVYEKPLNGHATETTTPSHSKPNHQLATS